MEGREAGAFAAGFPAVLFTYAKEDAGVVLEVRVVEGDRGREKHKGKPKPKKFGFPQRLREKERERER